MNGDQVAVFRHRRETFVMFGFARQGLCGT